MSNFRRVKYHPNLALNKKDRKVESTVWTDSVKLKRHEVKPLYLATKNSKFIYPQKELKLREPIPVKAKDFDFILNENNHKKTFRKSDLISLDDSLIMQSENKYWWEDDIEDWPWKQIVLVIIAVLLISIVITLLVKIIGGLLSGLVGLILLLLLAYFLIGAWT